MTLHIELEPQDLQTLEAYAARLGVPVERVATDAMRRELNSHRDEESGRPSERKNSDFLERLAQSAPRIAAGTLRPLTSEDISHAIADTRP